MPSQPSSLSDRVVIQHSQHSPTSTSDPASPDSHPIISIILSLSQDLSSPQWELRHGAALGLFHILSPLAPSLPSNFLSHIAAQLLTVLALDRFTDFVGDCAVVPVREMCAQALGVCVKSIDEPDARLILEKLLQLIEIGDQKRWEARLAGLIGLKYWLAVREDLLPSVLSSSKSSESPVFSAIINGLKDHDDDIRAVSTSTLLPITSLLVSLLPATKIYSSIVSTLWACLSDLDDLTSSTASVMDLLSNLISTPEIQKLSKKVYIEKVYPFFRHAMSSVRTAVLKTVNGLVTSNPKLATRELTCLVFQNLILEQSPQVLQLSKSVWHTLSNHKNSNYTPTISDFESWVALVMTPLGTPIDPKMLYSPQVSVHDKAMADQDLTVINPLDVIHGRVTAATAIGEISHKLPETDLDTIIMKYLASNSAWHRVYVNIIIQESQLSVELTGKVADALTVYLNDVETMKPTVFSEMYHHVTTLKSEYDNIAKTSGEIFDPVAIARLLSQQPGLNNLSLMFANYTDRQRHLEMQVSSSSARTLVQLTSISKMNPVVKPLMAAIQFEDTEILQTRAADAIARLVEKKPRQCDKVVKNIVSLICDPKVVGKFEELKDVRVGILSYKQDKDDPSAAAEDTAIPRRGGEIVIKSICEVFKNETFNKVSKLREIVNSITLPEESQEVLDTLYFISVAAKYFVYPDQHQILISLIPRICELVKSEYAIIRTVSAKCIAALSANITVPVMRDIILHIIPLLTSESPLNHRQGATETIAMVLETLEDKILPYIVFLVVPVLTRMSEHDEETRFVSTNVFASLVKLIPLESGVPDPEGIPEDMVKMRHEERRFMGQLVGSEKVESVEVKYVDAELRGYQKEGVNWLGFLNRYHLHGILCDDMGLGKTLQTICMLVTDHVAKRENGGVKPKPSIVVCPSTLTGHWMDEIKRYTKVLNPLVYVGTPSERDRIRGKIKKCDVLITSYNIVSKDIAELCGFEFNYCVLDEGHVIKNQKTKITQSVKSLKADNRLILSGTPIQNNVLELWSLFDFLMPGFLGTAKQFNTRFSKPILASRDAKSTSKEQEAGALAMEALHKQVLPFLLRRMKEDVLDDLPPKIIQDYYCELSEIQRLLYDNFAQSSAKVGAEKALIDSEDDEEEEEKKGKKSQHVFQALQYLRKLCNHPMLVLNEKHPKYDDVMNKLAAEKPPSGIRDLKNAPKLLALEQLLKECGIGTDEKSDTDSNEPTTIAPHRALIFAQVKPMLDIIESDLFKSRMPSVTYMRMDGTTDPNSRHELVKKFNADPSIDVLLLTTHVGGLGLNLTGADTVIFVEHDWNPMKDLQAMDRAHRIGQKRVVNVYRLITRGTLEEKIMGLQKFKMNIASSVINQENSGIKSMSTDQILDLFTLAPTSSENEDSVGSKRKAEDDDEVGVGGRKKKHATTKEVLGEMEELWDDEYKGLGDMEDFMKKLK